MIKCSVVVPFLNEESSVTELYDRLKTVLENRKVEFELIFVDDGSTDKTFLLLGQIAQVDSRVVVIKLRHRFGKTAALAAGFERARGEYVVTMDGDLQHDPEDIPRFLEKLDEGYDVVCGWRTHRVDNLWMRKIPSRCANWLMAKLSGVDIHDFGGGYKAYRRELLNEVPLYGELQRFIPALAAAYGAQICEIGIENIPRRYGVSRYGISRIVPVLFDLITIRFLLFYISRPLHLFGLFGFLSTVCGSVIGLWLVAMRLIYNARIMADHGPLMMFSAVLILTGFQLLAVGLLGEMQVRHYHELSGRGRYSIACVLDSSPKDEAHTADQ
jgi:glycosyltransferase involved in cell wall biosynthesis